MNEQEGTVVFRKTDDVPFAMGHQLERLNLVFDPEKTEKVTAAPMIPEADRLGDKRGEKVLPGPFAIWENTGSGFCRMRIWPD